MKYGLAVVFFLGVLGIPSCIWNDDDIQSSAAKYFFVKGISVTVGTKGDPYSEFKKSAFQEEEVIDTFFKGADSLVLEVLIDSFDYVVSNKEAQPLNFGNVAIAEPAPEPGKNAPKRIEVISDSILLTEDHRYEAGEDISGEFLFYDTNRRREWADLYDYLGRRTGYYSDTRIYMKLNASLEKMQSHKFTVNLVFARHQVEVRSKRVTLQ